MIRIAFLTVATVAFGFSVCQPKNEMTNVSLKSSDGNAREMKDFYREVTRYAYCGTTGGFDVDRGYVPGDRLIDAGWPQRYYNADRLFFEAVRKLENAGEDRTILMQEAAGVRAAWEVLSEDSHRDIRFHIAFLEYALLRICESTPILLSCSDVNEILHSRMFEDDVNSTVKCRLGELRMFKDMICVAFLVKKFLNDNGRLPNSLSEMDCAWVVDKYGKTTEYLNRDDTWQLFLPGAKGGVNKAPFNVYVPSVLDPGVRFWPQSKCLWLSSDFSEKRRRLFEHGALIQQGLSWSCELTNGEIVRAQNLPR